jgi:hypothetical protein
MKKLLVIFILALSIFLPSVVFGKDISGTAWVFYQPDGDKDVVFFENDGTVTYLQIISNAGNEGEVFSKPIDTWKINGDKVVISYTNGYMIVSLTINSRGDKMYGTSINKAGLVEKVEAKLIE